MKKILSLILCLVMTLSVVPVFSASAANADPSANYTVQTAPFEDSDIQMWFNHANVKVHQEDTASTGRNTYSVYMAKNEYQGTQVTLYSPSITKELISAEISDFTAMDGSGATMTADVYYEFYIKCDDLDVTDVLGVESAEDSFIRNGLIPDPIAKVSEINRQAAPGKFTLTAGKTQTLYIKIKSELDTPAGWYSAQFNVTDTDGKVIKTATVYAHVWNFGIPEAGHYQTGFYIDMENGLGEDLYRHMYDYLLDNRLCAMNLPGTLDSSNEYLSNPRVTAFRVSNKYSYLGLYDTEEIRAIYDDLSSREDWDEIKDKVYFYTADEPRSPGSPTIHNVRGRYRTVANGWQDPHVLVTVDENHPYPDLYSSDAAYDASTGTYLTADDGSGRFDGYIDAVQGMMDEESVNVWCIKTDAFTPRDVILSLGYDGNYRTTKVKNYNGTISGFALGDPVGQYFDWDSLYGPFSERFAAYQTEKAAEGKDVRLWIYECGKGPDYTYCNHLIENTGLQTELLFWQSMQVGATGYLYYGANLWTENINTSYTEGTGLSYDGSLESGRWRTNRHVAHASPGENYIYGNGVLVYGKDVKVALRIGSVSDPVGTVRVEHMRDGIEDYEMLYLYREAFGEAAMQNFIKKVSNNVVDYLSMPSFDTSSYAGKTAEDIFAEVRIELGNAVEEANGEPEVIIGDVNDDGLITLSDLAALKKFLAGVSGAEANVANSDVSGDGLVTIADIGAIKKLLA